MQEFYRKFMCIWASIGAGYFTSAAFKNPDLGVAVFESDSKTSGVLKLIEVHFKAGKLHKTRNN